MKSLKKEKVLLDEIFTFSTFVILLYQQRILYLILCIYPHLALFFTTQNRPSSNQFWTSGPLTGCHLPLSIFLSFHISVQKKRPYCYSFILGNRICCSIQKPQHAPYTAIPDPATRESQYSDRKECNWWWSMYCPLQPEHVPLI